MRFGYGFLLASSACLIVSVLGTGCASTPKSVASVSAAEKDREPTSLPRSSFTIVGGIRILNMGRNEGIVTLLRERHNVQPIRAKCAVESDRAASVSLQIDYGDDLSSKTLDLNHTNAALAAQTNMSACLVLLDKLMEASTYYPAYITFSDDHHIKVGF